MVIKNQQGKGNGPHFLFKNFLDDKRVYRLNQAFWRKQIRKTLGKDFPLSTLWVRETFNNGRPFYDGNPIFSARLSSDKALRIVQEEPESNTVEFGYWTEKTSLDRGQVVEEMVISLELSRESRQLAIDAIQKFINK
ncbi:MAG: hypothetical protein IPH04_19040 [Saprospirales bacterium]|nr:hypothetical protein [Saprospirales bacterium]